MEEKVVKGGKVKHALVNRNLGAEMTMYLLVKKRHRGESHAALSRGVETCPVLWGCQSDSLALAPKDVTRTMAEHPVKNLIVHGQGRTGNLESVLHEKLLQLQSQADRVL